MVILMMPSIQRKMNGVLFDKIQNNLALLSQRIFRASKSMHRAIVKLIPVDKIKPINEPIVAIEARFKSFESYINSPINAPNTSPIIKPKIKGENKPIIAPITAP